MICVCVGSAGRWVYALGCPVGLYVYVCLCVRVCVRARPWLSRESFTKSHFFSCWCCCLPPPQSSLGCQDTVLAATLSPYAVAVSVSPSPLPLPHTPLPLSLPYTLPVQNCAALIQRAWYGHLGRSEARRWRAIRHATIEKCWDADMASGANTHTLPVLLCAPAQASLLLLLLLPLVLSAF